MAFRSASGSGLGSEDGVEVSVLMVGQRFLNSCFRWPFVVYGEREICMEMSYSVSTGQVLRCTFFSFDECKRCGSKTCGLD